MNYRFVTGKAGSGKSFSVMEKIKADPSWAVMAATTGIASINLGTVTLNSLLGYFDTESLRGIQKTGQLFRKLRDIKSQYQWLVIDEVSMMDGDQLTIIAEECGRIGLGVYLTGDFLQLPVVKGKWCFESPVWPRFEANTTRLTKVWRQTEGNHLDMLNYARAGLGTQAAGLLNGFQPDLDDNFDGTTLISKNAEVDAYNQRALAKLPGKPFRLTNRRWGKARGEWKNIPEVLELKEGAYVMLLSNTYDDLDGDLVYANGDCGHVVESHDYGLTVKLVRSGEEVEIGRVSRNVSRAHRPKPWFNPCYSNGGWLEKPHWDEKKQKFVEGQIKYWPIRLSWASTIHKCQGLSLDRVQLDTRDNFCGQPGMLYVGMSRCRTMEGLRIVGDRETFIKHCNVDPKTMRWL